MSDLISTSPVLMAESPLLLPPSPSRDDISRSLEAARLAGWRVFEIPPDFSECETADNGLGHVPFQEEPTAAVWLGYIPDAARYEAMYQAALSRNLVLLNTPEQHRVIQEFDAAYSFIEGLTPRSVVVKSEAEALQRVEEIGFPVFVKGVVQSRKSRGLSACVAENEVELSARVRALLELELRSRGRVVLRELVKLRHTQRHGDFPVGREFRAFLLDGKLLAVGFYWPHADEGAQLSPMERQIVEELVHSATRRLPARFVAVDVGQLDYGEWTVIETGDPQFSGLAQIAPLAYWHRLRLALESVSPHQ